MVEYTSIRLEKATAEWLNLMKTGTDSYDTVINRFKTDRVVKLLNLKQETDALALSIMQKARQKDEDKVNTYLEKKIKTVVDTDMRAKLANKFKLANDKRKPKPEEE